VSESFSLSAAVAAPGPELTLAGRARRHGVLPEQACVWFAREQQEAGDWRRLSDAERDLELRPLTDRSFAGALDDALRALGLDGLVGEATVVRHAAGGRGLPPAPGGGFGFVLDLNAAWRSGWGGLLLFVDEHGRAHGWRPEAGAITVYDPARPPLLTAVTAGAPPRLSVVGRTG
jgi:hypothetical protein